jgi:putative transposase
MYLNSVYLDPHSEPPLQLRIVFEHADFLMMIDINDGKAWPYSIALAEFSDLNLKLIDEPITLRTPEANSKIEEARNRAYKTISPLLDVYSELFDKQLRNKHIKSLLSTVKESRLYITRQLRRYWQRGMTPDALN